MEASTTFEIPNQKKINFGAGPSYLADEVLIDSAKSVLKIPSLSSGESILEVSHRSAYFKQVLTETETNLRTLLEIPENYSVLFMQGGGTGQFASAPLNLLAHHYGGKKSRGGYIVSGTWSLAAFNEAKSLHLNPKELWIGKAVSGNFDNVPTTNDLEIIELEEEELAYIYYCANETVNGVEIFDLPKQLPSKFQKVDLVCDMSSNILGRKVDVSKFAIIFAGAQKNLGPSGITCVIVRKDILDRPQDHKVSLPSVLDYKVVEKHGSAHNTPPTFTILSLNYALQYYLSLKPVDSKGVQFIQDLAIEKANLIYDTLDSYPEVFKVNVRGKKARSLTNLTFQLHNPELEAKFLKGMEENNFINVKGHRSVGGIRISLYNANLFRKDQPVEKLQQFLLKFAKEN